MVEKVMAAPNKLASDTVIGVDLGGTKISAALVDSTGKIVNERRVTTGAGQGAELIIAKMIGLAQKLRGDAAARQRRVLAVGVGSPGWQGTELSATMRESTGIPSSAGNDGNVAAVDERMFGATSALAMNPFILLAPAGNTGTGD